MVNSVKLPILRCCILLILIGAAAGGSIRSAQCSVIWTFDETSCTAANGSDCTFQPPGGLAQLVLPDIDSSGSWSFFYDSSTNMMTETGDTDFSFQLAGPSPSFQAPRFHLARPEDAGANVDYEIAFASSPSSLSLASCILLILRRFLHSPGERHGAWHLRHTGARRVFGRHRFQLPPGLRSHAMQYRWELGARFRSRAIIPCGAGERLGRHAYLRGALRFGALTRSTPIP